MARRKKMANRNISVRWLPRLLFAALLACSWAVQAADFAFKDLRGKSHRLSDYKGKWVLVNFWATWCPPCLHEIPELVSLQKAREDIQVIGIAMDSGTAKVVTAFAKKQGITYPVVMGDRKVQSQIGEIEGLPTSFLYNPQGKQVSYKVGEITRESIEIYIKNYKPK
jgi:thiol-disulfide isomerase/thioredoxin